MPHKFSHRVTGAVPCGPAAAGVQCRSSHFSLRESAPSCERSLTDRICIFCFCRYLNIPITASILNAEQQEKMGSLFIIIYKICEAVLMFRFLRLSVRRSFVYSGLSSNSPAVFTLEKFLDFSLLEAAFPKNPNTPCSVGSSEVTQQFLNTTESVRV